MQIRGVLFDKDGTLFDFDATWAAWTGGLLRGLAGGDDGLTAQLAVAIDYDLARRAFLPGSIFVAGSASDVAAALLPHLPGHSHEALFERINLETARAPQIGPVDLRPFLSGLRAKGMSLGVATNDAIVPAKAHLAQADVLELFDFVAGSDSGHGAKPGPGMCHAFLAETGLAAAEVVMVGDSTHDLHAGRAAGMRTAGVLTGYAGGEALTPLADIVLPSIADLPAWFDSLRA